MQKESELLQHSNAPVFSSARFDEDSIIVYPLLIITTAGLYFGGFPYFALIPALVLVMIFVVEVSERVILVPLKKAQILGNKCMVMKRVSYGEKGVVKIIDNTGISQWELWSAESNYDFEEGSIARVKNVDGLFLQIEPL
jgi:membrane protein implicated in regulation of membrane protease activity